MKKFTINIIIAASFIIAVLTVSSPTIYAQTPVEISKEKVRVNGTLMYAHKVLKGQTVYSICKVYQVTSEDLQAANPSLASGLKEGMLLVIPIKDASAEPKENKDKSLTEKAKELGQKVVDKTSEIGSQIGEKSAEIWQKTKEMVVGKSEPKKKEEDTVVQNIQITEKEEIIQDEPTIDDVDEQPVIEQKREQNKEEKKEGQNKENKTDIVKEKTTEVDKDGVQKEGDTFTTHKVKWYEDLDEIADQYNINKDLIKFYNGLPDYNLDKISTLKIPTGKTLERVKTEFVHGLHKTTEKPNNNTLPNTIAEHNTPIVSQQNILLQGERDKESNEKNIALILPLHSKNKLSATYMDFYSGALLAISDLNTTGGNYKFSIIDQSEYSNAESLIRVNKLENKDLIIGPIRSSDIKDYIGFINEHKIPMISPLDPSAEELKEQSPYLFQVPLSPDAQDAALVGWISLNLESIKEPVTLIWEEGGKDSEQVSRISNLLKQREIDFSQISFPLSKATSVDGLFKKRFTPSSSHIVIIASNSEGFVAEALRNLSLLQVAQDNIRVFGLNRWRNFENLDLNLFFQFNVHLVSPYYVNLAKENVQDFINQYREAYKSEPSANAFSGYDIVKLASRYVDFNPQYGFGSINNPSNIVRIEGIQQYFLIVAQNAQSEEDGTIFLKIINENYGITGVEYLSNYTVTSTSLIVPQNVRNSNTEDY